MSQEIIRELGGRVLIESIQEYQDGQTINQEFRVSTDDGLSWGTDISLEEALTKVLQQRKQKATTPKENDGPANAVIKELGGEVCAMSQARWQDGQKVEERWSVFLPGESVSENSQESFDDALQKLAKARQEYAARPKVVYVHKYDSEDYDLLDELLTYATLLDYIEHDLIDGNNWINDRMIAILCATSKKLVEIHKKLYAKG